MEFIDTDGNIIVPKAVRPIIDFKETALGSKKGAKRQYRYGNLHIRDYDTHYTLHMDKVNPLTSPLGHLLMDAPEYLAGAAAAVIIGRCVGAAVYRGRKRDGKSSRDAAIAAVVAGYLAGSSVGNIVFSAASSLKNGRR